MSLTFNGNINWSGSATMRRIPTLVPGLFTWGINTNGAVGDGTVVSRSSPVQISSASWTSVATGHAGVGRGIAGAVKSDGTLWMWGYNAVGSVGDGTTAHKSSPVQIGSLTTWTKVACGYATYAIKSDNTLWSWGYGWEGQLGNNTSGVGGLKSSPVQATGTNWKQVSAWGVNAVAAVKNDGTLWTWGMSDAGQSGRNTTAQANVPTQVGALTNWDSVSCGDGFVLAVKTDGTLWAWGTGSAYRLGLGASTVNRSSPVQIGTDTNWSKAAAGAYNGYAIKTNGTLWAWGDGAAIGNGQVGINQQTPVQIGADTNWADIDASDSFAIARRTTGTLWTWGIVKAAMGTGATAGQYSSPVQIGTATNWSLISTAFDTTIASQVTG